MNPAKFKMANEWMQQESATPQEALNTWNEMEAEFKANRAVVQEPGSMVGTPTEEVTQFDRRIYETPEGERVSEKSTTFFLNGKWLNVPTIHNGRSFTDDQLRFMIKQGQIQPTSVHGSRNEAEEAAGQRSSMMKSHVKGFEDGGRIGYADKNAGKLVTPKKKFTWRISEEAKKEAYAERAARDKMRTEKKYKEIVDSFIEKGDYENFKSQVYESQKKHKLPSGKWRQTKGGRIPTHIKKFITDRLDAGPGSELFEDLIRITGRTEEELLDFSSKIPKKGSQTIKQRSKKAEESWSEERKLTDEEKLEGEKKQKDVRKTKAKPGIEAASEADLKNYRTVANQRKSLNAHFINNPNAINNTEYGKEIKKLMETRLAKKDMEVGGKKIKAGEIYRRIKDSSGNFLNDAYYKNLAKQGKIFDIFDINKIAKGQISTKFATNLNLLPSQFNSGFIEGNVDRFFGIDSKTGKKGAFYGDKEKLKIVDDHLKKIGVRVDIGDIGRIGSDEIKVFYDSKTKKFPHMYNTLKKMKIPDRLLTGINPITHPEGITSPPKNIKGAISMELLDDMFKAGKITVGTARGIMQAARKIGAEFEIAFILGEYFNNIGKGQKPNLAWANAKQSATMGLQIKVGDKTYGKSGDKEYLEELKKLAKEEGIDPSTFEKVYEINKRDHLATTMGMTGQLSPLAQINTLEEQLKELKSTPKIFQDKKMITAKENLLNIKKGQLEKYKKETWDKESELIFDIRKNKAGYRNNIRPNLDKIADTPVYEDEYSDVFQNLGSIAVKYLDKEKKKAYDPKKPLVPEKIKRLLNIPADQSEQLHPDMGPWGNWLSTNIFTLDARGKAKEQARILDMAKKNKRELYLYNLARDNVPGVSLGSFLDLAETKPGLGFRTEEASGGRAGYMGGGITNLKIKW